MPVVNQTFDHDQGAVTSRLREDLREGELQRAEHLYYKRGNPREIHVLPGRSAFGDTGADARVNGPALCQFDGAGTDQLVAQVGTVLYGATPGATGTFSSLKTGLTAATHLNAAHYQNKWFLSNGQDRQQVLKSDGTVRDMSLEMPEGTAMTSANSAGVTAALLPQSDTSNFTNSTNAYDGDTDTFALATLSTGSVSETYDFNGAGGASASRTMVVSYSVSVPQRTKPDPDYEGEDIVLSDTTAAVKIEYNIGAGWVEVINRTFASDQKRILAQATFTADPDDLDVRITLTHAGDALTVSLQVYEVRYQQGGAVANFSTTPNQPLRYFFTEYIEDPSGQNIESPRSEIIEVELSTENEVTFTFPTQVNTSATHRRVYRTAANGEAPLEAGLHGEALISETTYTDTFEKWLFLDDTGALTNDSTLVNTADGTYPVIVIRNVGVDTTNDVFQSGFQAFDRDIPAPIFQVMRGFRNRLVGIKGTNREIRYSMAGKPESWPALYRLAIATDKNDVVVNAVNLSSILLVLTKETAVRVPDLPSVEVAVLESAKPDVLEGAPGCVGPKAATSMSISQRETLAAWISPYGIVVSNGSVHDYITDDLDWDSLADDKSGWSLHWDFSQQILMMATESAVYFFHMAPEHRKSSGQPKITGPHTGSVSGYASGQVANVYRIYSGHTSNGIVSLERDTGTDGNVVLKSRRIYGDRDFSTLDAQLRHTAFGLAETATVDWTVGRDSAPNSERTKQKTITVAERRATHFDVAIGGQYAEYTFTYTGSQTGSLLDLRTRIRPLGQSGTVRVA